MTHVRSMRALSVIALVILTALLLVSPAAAQQAYNAWKQASANWRKS